MKINNHNQFSLNPQKGYLPLFSYGMLAFFLIFIASVNADEKIEPAVDFIQAANNAGRRGDLFEQIIALGHAIDIYKKQDDKHNTLTFKLQRAGVMISVGQYIQAVNELKTLVKDKSLTPEQRVMSFSSLGNALSFSGYNQDAEKWLRQATDEANALNNNNLKVAVFNNLGNHLAKTKAIPKAREIYLHAISIAKQSNESKLLATTLLNAARGEQIAGESNHANDYVKAALSNLETLPPGHDKAYALINAARLLQLEQKTGIFGNINSSLKYRVLENAKSLATKINDKRAVSYATGYLGEINKNANRYKKALEFTQTATFFALKLQAHELIYQWEWQAGQILNKMGDSEAAILAYQRAIFSLEKVRSEISQYIRKQGGSFREKIGTLYLEYADLMLQYDKTAKNSKIKVQNLIDARDSIEKLKRTELEDYFLDECVLAIQSKKTTVENIGNNTAVIYPILLKDRVEIILTLPSGITHQSTSITREKAISTVTQLREALNITEHKYLHTVQQDNSYLKPAKQLFNWLLRPVMEQLVNASIDTLVIVPDRELLTIPFSALHDGENYVIKNYAVTVTPSLWLTEPRPLSAQSFYMLVGGLTEKVQGYKKLDGVAEELTAIEKTLGKDRVKIIRGQSFTPDMINHALNEKPYNVLHLATHATFGGEIGNSFILTQSGKINLDQLETMAKMRRFTRVPIELLTFSACQTAEGDVNAALGLAGVAIKSGARSALGSLWDVDDWAAAALIEKFYQQLVDKSITKAKALQAAQLVLLNNPDFEHPGFWSPFILIGNWL